MKRKQVREHISSEVLRISNYRCFYCQAVFDQENPPTLDHVIPVSRGGTNELKNLVAACFPCNVGKGSKPIGEAFESRRYFEEAVRVYLGLSRFELRILRLIRKMKKWIGRTDKTDSLC